jgi:hypothetical protein
MPLNGQFFVILTNRPATARACKIAPTVMVVEYAWYLIPGEASLGPECMRAWWTRTEISITFKLADRGV